jgi:CRISPR-associated protein Cmr6
MMIDRKDLDRYLQASPSSEEKKQPTGKKIGIIKKIIKDFGFIKVEGEKDVHFRFENVTSYVPGGRIQEGLKVSFEMGEDRSGRATAIKIEVIGSPTMIGESEKAALENYYLPADTRHVLDRQLINQNRVVREQQIDNFALLLNKCAYYDSDPKSPKFLLYRKNAIELKPVFDRDMLKAVNERHRTTIDNLNFTIKKFSLETDWRLIVGLGNESVYETSMTLHHIYGIPYIPGQAVKGVVRSWIIVDTFGGSENNALQDPGFCDIFGCPAESAHGEARQGDVIFFDAFPTTLEQDSIQADIMNPHYGPYYSDGKPPADYHNPVPVNFLTVQNTTFEFYIGIKQRHNLPIRDEKSRFTGQTPLAIVAEWLPKALIEHGIGAKTAVGYGYFHSATQ